MESSDLIAVGEILKPQGLRGEVKLLSLTDNPRRFGEIRRVYFQTPTGWRELVIEAYHHFKGFVLLKFEGINDLTAAQSLGRGLIYILRQERPALPPGRYYQDQLIGLKVYEAGGRLLGQITQILQTGANDVYLVKQESGELLIPALQQVVREIDLVAGQMTVELPPGLVEEPK